MLNLMDYREEIIAIAKANDVSWADARDMFLANIKNAGEDALPYYEGAEEVDYLALKEELPEMGTPEYAGLCEDFNRDFREAMDAEQPGD